MTLKSHVLLQLGSESHPEISGIGMAGTVGRTDHSHLEHFRPAGTGQGCSQAGAPAVHARRGATHSEALTSSSSLSTTSTTTKHQPRRYPPSTTPVSSAFTIAPRAHTPYTPVATLTPPTPPSFARARILTTKVLQQALDFPKQRFHLSPIMKPVVSSMQAWSWSVSLESLSDLIAARSDRCRRRRTQPS